MSKKKSNLENHINISNNKEILNFGSNIDEKQIEIFLEDDIIINYFDCDDKIAEEKIDANFDESDESDKSEESEESDKSLECNKEQRGNFVSGQSSITSYMKGMVDCKVVTKEEEFSMFKALQAGDATMVDAIFKANARLVPFVVKRFAGVIAKNPSMDFEDLISAGNLGLLKAIGLFDPDKGYKFSTYAYNWIFSFAERAIYNDANLIRIPVHLQEKVIKFKKAEKELEASINRKLTYEERLELLETLGSPIDVFSMEKYEMCTSPVSLNTTINEEGDELGVFITSDEALPEDIAFYNVLKEEILEAMEECLPARNIEVLKLRFGFKTGECMTLEEVGGIFGVTRERIRQIESKSIRILRRSKKFRYLKDYLGVK